MQARLMRQFYLLALILVVGYLVYLLSPILAPFAIAALFAYLFDPLVDKLETWKLSRTLAVTVVFLIITLLMITVALILIPALERQISYLIKNLPVYITWLKDNINPWLQAQFGLEVDLFDTGQLSQLLKEHWESAGGVAQTVISSVTKSGMVVLNWVMNLLLIPVVLFYLLRDWDIITARVGELIPRRYYDTVYKITHDSNSVLSAFLRGQLSVMLALGIIYTVGLWLVGVELALLIGMGAGLVSFVPYLGAITGLIGGVIAALVQFGDLIHVVYVLIVFGVGQLLEGMVLTPWLVGDKIGLHPVAVIFAVLAGGQLFGFVGVLLGLPLAAVVMVLLRHAHHRYVKSELYGESAQAQPSSEPDV